MDQSPDSTSPEAKPAAPRSLNEARQTIDAIQTSLVRLRRMLGWPESLPLTVDPGQPGAGEWASIPDLTLASPGVSEAIDDHCAQLGTDNRNTAATLLWKDYCQVATLLPIAAWTVDRRVLGGSAPNVAIRIARSTPRLAPAYTGIEATILASDPLLNGLSRSGPNAALPTPESVTLVATESELLEALTRNLFAHHLTPLGALFSEAVGVAPKILLGLAVSVAIASLVRVQELTDRDGFDEAAQLIAAFDAKDLIDLAALTPPGRTTPEPMALRFVCCQAHRVEPKHNCSTCPLISDDERTQTLEPYGYRWHRL